MSRNLTRKQQTLVERELPIVPAWLNGVKVTVLARDNTVVAQADLTFPVIPLGDPLTQMRVRLDVIRLEAETVDDIPRWQMIRFDHA